MIVTLDGQRVDEAFAPNPTLQTVIDHVRAVQAADRLIVSVAIDGHRLGDAELSASLDQCAPADGQVDLESRDRYQLVREALGGLALEFEQARPRLGEIADRLSAGDVADAVRDVGNFVGLWQTCYRALAHCSGLLGEDLAARECVGRSVSTQLDEVVAKLAELRGALEAHDMVLLADLVRYEFQPLTETWQTLLTALAEQIGKRCQEPFSG